MGIADVQIIKLRLVATPMCKDYYGDHQSLARMTIKRPQLITENDDNDKEALEVGDMTS